MVEPVEPVTRFRLLTLVKAANGDDLQGLYEMLPADQMHNGKAIYGKNDMRFYFGKDGNWWVTNESAAMGRAMGHGFGCGKSLYGPEWRVRKPHTGSWYVKSNVGSNFSLTIRPDDDWLLKPGVRPCGSAHHGGAL